MPLPLYDPERRCPKCGGEARAVWFPEVDVPWRRVAGYKNNPECEHINRRCQTCHYNWPERPLDSEPKETPDA